MQLIDPIPEIKMYLFSARDNKRNDFRMFTCGKDEEDAFIQKDSVFVKVKSSEVKNELKLNKHLINENFMSQISDTLHRKDLHFKRFLFNRSSWSFPCVVQLSKIEKDRIIASLEFRKVTDVFIFNSKLDEEFISTLFNMVSMAESFYDSDFYYERYTTGL